MPASDEDRLDTTALVERVAQTIVSVRGQRVILDTRLAELYGVTTKRLNEQVKRNAARFPNDFLFRLTAEEAAALRSQIATSKRLSQSKRGGTRYHPFAFTEHGAIMAATILNSPGAVETSAPDSVDDGLVSSADEPVANASRIARITLRHEDPDQIFLGIDEEARVEEPAPVVHPRGTERTGTARILEDREA